MIFYCYFNSPLKVLWWPELSSALFPQIRMLTLRDRQTKLIQEQHLRISVILCIWGKPVLGTIHKTNADAVISGLLEGMWLKGHRSYCKESGMQFLCLFSWAFLFFCLVSQSGFWIWKALLDYNTRSQSVLGTQEKAAPQLTVNYWAGQIHLTDCYSETSFLSELSLNFQNASSSNVWCLLNVPNTWPLT